MKKIYFIKIPAIKLNTINLQKIAIHNLIKKADILSQIFNIKTEEEFNATCLAVFQYQFAMNAVYQTYVKSINVAVKKISHHLEIPFLPIGFFKTQQVITTQITSDTVKFTSSGTTGQIPSTHYIIDVDIYRRSFNLCFDKVYGNPEQYCIVALLPNYLSRNGSSLVYMCNDLILQSNNSLSGFYLENLDELERTLKTLKENKQKTILIGVTYALLDLAERNIKLNENFIVMETGGMKGKRDEITKEEMHYVLKEKFNVKGIHSEYGMTELLSQAYSLNDGIFKCPPWMRLLTRDTSDPFTLIKPEKVGGINIIDLANLDSCSFIETKDLGKVYEDNTFEINGRFDNSDLRGCNLMVNS